MGIDNRKPKEYHYTGIYRGTVIYNTDPDIKGKVKIFVPGVYPDEYRAKPEYLPWAEPAMGLFGGSWTNENPDEYGNHLNSEVGWCTVPHKGNTPDQGAEVYLFFEHGDINFPVYFAAVQAGKGWFSEHDNQHVFRSDNVTVRIDQNTSNERSTSKFSPYIQNNNEISKRDHVINKTSKGLPPSNIPTRLDIQIQANKMIAVNLQISGDVNIKQIGDMYIEQTGNRHQTLIGNRYVKHIGGTYIEHDGVFVSRQVGKNQQYVEGNKLSDVVGNLTTRTFGVENREVRGECNQTVGSNFKLTVGKKYDITVTEDMTTQVFKNYALNVTRSVDSNIGRNCSIVIGRDKEPETGTLYITAANNIQMISSQGNITIETLGQFELLNDFKAITSDGYKNIGTKGNVFIRSNMGNIAIETVGNDEFEKDCMVVPWNPMFLSNLQFVSSIVKDFDPTQVLFTNNILSISDIGQLLQFIMNLPLSIIYDGLPAFFPCKMITQNPNISPVDQFRWRLYEYKHYSEADDDWREVTNLAYWKIIGRLVGNIDIRSWSGDINIATEGRLGNAGNINITAQDSIGTLPEYKGGNVNISNKAKPTIHTDPRNLFFDSQGILNRQNILTNGTGLKPGRLFNYLNVFFQSGTAGGCASCIADAFLSVIAPFVPIPKMTLEMYKLNIDLHDMNSISTPPVPAPPLPEVMIPLLTGMIQKNIDSVKNLTWKSAAKSLLQGKNPLNLSLDDLKSIFSGMAPFERYNFTYSGFGHACDNGYIDWNNTINHGTINIDSDSSLNLNARNDYSLNADTKYLNDGYSFSTTVEPNWRCGHTDYLNKLTYLPMGRNVYDMGNTLTLSQSFGNNYMTNYQYKQTRSLVYNVDGILTMMPNTSTDSDVVSYTYMVGKKLYTINQNSNDFWLYNPFPYLDPQSVIKDPFMTINLPSLPAYTENYLVIDDYKTTITKTFDQMINKNAAQLITIINNILEQNNKFDILLDNDIQLDYIPLSHNRIKSVGFPGISNIINSTNGSLNFDTSNTTLMDWETHRSMLNMLQYDSLAYNADIRALAERQCYLGARSIESDLVSWAVKCLSFQQL